MSVFCFVPLLTSSPLTIVGITGTHTAMSIYFISDLGVLHNVTPTPLKEQFLKMLESKEDTREEMLNILKMEGTVTQYATVSKLVRSYEESFGQLSLDEWKNILAHFGFGKCYHQCLAAHRRDVMASAGKLFLTGPKTSGPQYPQDQSRVNCCQ